MPKIAHLILIINKIALKTYMKIRRPETNFYFTWNVLRFTKKKKNIHIYKNALTFEPWLCTM